MVRSSGAILCTGGMEHVHGAPTTRALGRATFTRYAMCVGHVDCNLVSRNQAPRPGAGTALPCAPAAAQFCSESKAIGECDSPA